jgi:TonB family protein
LLLPESALPGSLTIRASAVANSGMAGTGIRGNTSAQYATAIWAAGFALLLIRLAVAGFQASALVHGSQEESRRTYPVRLSDRICTPIAWSFGSGAVVLPSEAGTWNASEFEAAVRHETAHLARHDCEALLAGELACALYWFHPLVWYAAHRMRIEQEHAADDSVLRSGFEPVEYAEQLLRIVKSGRTERLLAGAGTPSMLSARVGAILDPKRRRTMLTRKVLLACVTAVLAVVLPLAGMQAERKVYKIGGPVTSPQLVTKTEPDYTPEARDAKIQGTVLLSGIIETDGRFSEVHVDRGLDPGLDKNAVDAVKLWLFQPAQKDGSPVAVSVHVEVNFRLR